MEFVWDNCCNTIFVKCFSTYRTTFFQFVRFPHTGSDQTVMPSDYEHVQLGPLVLLGAGCASEQTAPLGKLIRSTLRLLLY